MKVWVCDWMPIYAGIDIGTLTLRLLIARIGDDGRLHELASERRIVRLGEGLQPGRRLQPAPMARALETIAEWLPVIKRSEEHTSELQSLAYLVCRLLLEKKKNSNTASIYTTRAYAEDRIRPTRQ